MISLLITAFVMGGIGSFHCVGMCGPIALSLPVVGNNYHSRFISTLLYNLGRTTTYTCIGIITGLAGTTIALFGFGQLLSISIGLLIIIFVVFPKNTMVKNNLLSKGFEKLRIQLGKLLKSRNYHSVFYIGLLNGLLPCGLVYIAIAGAASTTSVIKSGLFMAAFGLGTLPLMWTLSFWGTHIKMSMRQNIKKLYPYIMVFMAVLLILRGLGLGIPYLSPAWGHHPNNGIPTTIECHD